MLDNRTKRLLTYVRIPDNIQQCDYIWTASQILQNLNFSLNFLLLYWFEYFDNALLVVVDVDTFKYFRVLSTSD